MEGKGNLRGVLVAMAAVVALLAFGCGSSDDDQGTATSGAAATSTAASPAADSPAQEVVTQAMAPTTSAPDIPPVDVGDKLKGKRLLYISSALAYPFSQEVYKGTKDGAQALGMSISAVDAQGDWAKASSSMDRAISSGVDGIILQGVDPYAIKASLSDAKAANIPVVGAVALGTIGPIDPEVADAGLAADTHFDMAAVGRETAAYVGANSDEGSKVGLIGSSNFRNSAVFVKAFKEALPEYCKGCQLAEEDSPIAQWQTTLPSLVRSMLAKNPDMSFLVPFTDAMMPGVQSSLAAAGGNTKVATWGASQGDLKTIKAGKGPEVANVGGANQWLGWATADNFARVATGVKPLEDPKVAIRLFTQENLQPIDLNGSPATFFGPFDFQGFYRQLWGVS